MKRRKILKTNKNSNADQPYNPEIEFSDEEDIEIKEKETTNDMPYTILLG